MGGVKGESMDEQKVKGGEWKVSREAAGFISGTVGVLLPPAPRDAVSADLPSIVATAVCLLSSQPGFRLISTAFSNMGILDHSFLPNASR